MLSPIEHNTIELQKLIPTQVLIGLAFMLAYLFAHLSMIIPFGLHGDEMLDWNGAAIGDYVANGRWCLALYKAIFGLGCMPVTAGLSAGLFFMLAYIVMLRIFSVHNLCTAAFCAVFFITDASISYHLHYSHQVDAVALGLLLSVLGTRLICIGNSLKGVWGAALLFACAIGCYQSLFLCPCVLVAVYLSNKVFSNNYTVKEAACLLMRAVSALAAAFMAYFALSKFALCLGIANENQITTCQLYQTCQFNCTLLSDCSVALKLQAVAHYLLCAVSQFFTPNRAGGGYFLCTIVPIIGLCFLYTRQRGYTFPKMLVLFSLLILSCLMPQLMHVVLGNDWVPAHVKIAGALSASAMWLTYLSHLTWRPGYGLFACIVAFLTLQWCACFDSTLSREKRTFSEHYISMLHAVEYDVIRYAARQNINLDHVHVLLFPAWDYNLYPCVDRPGGLGQFRYLHFPVSDAEYIEHLPLLKTMPVWPADGSIRVQGNTIIVKGTDTLQDFTRKP